MLTSIKIREDVMRARVGTIICAALIVGLAPTVALAQPWPTKPIRIVTPFPPGGSVDLVARLIAPKMAESLGQSVIVDNRTGASTNIGMEIVARAPGDGYTLLINSPAIVANPSLFPNLSFHPEKDFTPISLVVSTATIIFVHPSVPVRNVKELIALTKAKPGVLKYSSSGLGSMPHLAVELFSYYTQTNITGVTYRGGGPALIAALSGEVDITVQTLIASGGMIKSGRLRAVAVTSQKRLPQLPDVPTVAESGVPEYEYEIWVGVLAPASTPQAIITQLHEHVVKAARAPDVSERVVRDGAKVLASTPESFRETIAAETVLWATVIKKMGVKAD